MPTFDGHFPIPKSDENNDKLAAGPDGNMWVVIHEGENDVAKVKPDGSFEEFELEGIEGASGIALGPEGRMWVTQINKVASFDVSNPKASTKATTIATVTSSNPIVAGPDGQMWVAATENVVHFSPADPTKNGAFNVPKLAPKDIDVAGALLAIADSNNSRIVTITTAGVVKEIPLTGENGTSQGVAGSPTGQIAFSEQSQPEGLGLVTPPNPPSILQMQGRPIRRRPWLRSGLLLAMSAADDVQRLTPDGKNSPIEGFPPKFFPRQIAAGPNNTIWVTMEIPGEEVDEIARISGLEPPSTPTGGGRQIRWRHRPGDEDRQRPEEEGDDEGQTRLGDLPLQLDDRRRGLRMRPGQKAPQKSEKNAEAEIHGLHIAEEIEAEAGQVRLQRPRDNRHRRRPQPGDQQLPRRPRQLTRHASYSPISSMR